MKFEKRKLDPVLITLGGVEYPAKLTNRAMIELEDITGQSYTAFLEKVENGSAGILDVQTLLYAALKGGGVDLTLDDMLDADFSLFESADIMSKLGDVLDRAVGIETDLDTAGTTGKKKKAGSPPTVKPITQ